METIKIYSLNVVAFLKMYDFPILRIELENGTTVFHFESSDDVRKCIDEYHQDIRLKKFISSFKEIRSITKGLK